MMRCDFVVSIMLLLISGIISCGKKSTDVAKNTNPTIMETKITITANSKSFTAVLLNNQSAQAFIEMLPMTIEMNELNGNEKYYDLHKNIPTIPSSPGTVKKGEVMIFGSKTLVLFYQTIPTSYQYTKLGRINNVEGLAEALGNGNVRVALSSQ